MGLPLRCLGVDLHPRWRRMIFQPMVQDSHLSPIFVLLRAQNERSAGTARSEMPLRYRYDSCRLQKRRRGALGNISTKMRTTFRDPDMSQARARALYLRRNSKASKIMRSSSGGRPLVWAGADIRWPWSPLAWRNIVSRYRINTKQIFQEQRFFRYQNHR